MKNIFKRNKTTEENRIKALEAEIFPKEEKKVDDSWSRSLWYFGGFSTPLKKRVDNIIDSQAEDRKLLDMLLDKLGLEYVKITEENGDKKVKESLRKKKKKIIKKVEANISFDDEKD